MNHDDRERLTKLKLKFAAGLLVYARMPDVDARFRAGLSNGWALPVIREAGAAGEYGRHPPWLKPVASPQEITEMEAVMDWMAWIRRQPYEGDVAIRRIIGWATGTPMSVLGWRERCSERTIANRIDRSVAAVLREFFAVSVDVETVEELPERRAPVTSFTEPPARGAGPGPATVGAPDSLLPGKIWIAGVGMMFRGERYDPEGDAVRRAAAHQRQRRG